MNRKNIAYIILISVACALAVLTALSLYFAQTVDYDFTIEHFARNSLPAAVAAACVILSVPLAVAAGILCRRKNPCTASPSSGSPQIFAAALTAFMLFASFIFNIRALVTGLAALDILRLVFMALAAAYFFLTASRDNTASGAYALLSLCPLLYSLLSLLSAYFDSSYGMNSPVKTYSLLAYIAMTLFFSAEARIALGRTLPFWYAAFGVLCLTLTAGVGLSQTVIALNPPIGHDFALIDSAVFACVALYAATRLFAFGTEKPKTEESFHEKA